jgi:hypothetical protein
MNGVAVLVRPCRKLFPACGAIESFSRNGLDKASSAVLVLVGLLETAFQHECILLKLILLFVARVGPISELAGSVVQKRTATRRQQTKESHSKASCFS